MDAGLETFPAEARLTMTKNRFPTLRLLAVGLLALAFSIAPTGEVRAG